MKKAQLLKEFIRIDKTPLDIVILVREIDWDGPAKPISSWLEWKRLASGASEDEIKQTAALVLEDPAYFRYCVECGEQNPIGWMHDDRVCQTCAQSKHGVVY